MWTTGESSAPNATADAATAGEAKAEHATTRKTRGNETDSLLLSCPPNTPTHGEHTPLFQNRRKAAGEERRGKKKQRNKHGRENTMVFGDNVRARRAARALPRTPTQRRREEEEDGEDREQ